MTEPAHEYPPSPVPSDRNLWPGEKPFTAFGQWGEGKMDNRVFDQDIYWVDVKGNPHLLEDMSDEYRMNVIMFLRDNMAYFGANAAIRMVSELLGNIYIAPAGYCDTEETYRAAENFLAADTPEEWLESTPLMRRLRHLTNTQPPTKEL